MKLDSTTTVAEIVREDLSTTRLFEEIGIDYCCGGGKSLEVACEAAHRDVEEVLASLEAALTVAADGDGVDYARLDLGDLISHILETHHVFTKRELGRLPALIHKVSEAHGERHPELLEVGRLFDRLKAELEPHIWKEEQVLFPYVRTLLEARGKGESAPPSCFGTIANPVGMMRMEHEAAGEALATLRETARNYQQPEDACISYRALYQALEAFEKDLHLHIHLENNILFPRAVELEEAG